MNEHEHELNKNFAVFTDVAAKHSKRVIEDLSIEVEILEVITQTSRRFITLAVISAMVRDLIFIAESLEIAERGKSLTITRILENMLKTLNSPERNEKVQEMIKEALRNVNH